MLANTDGWSPTTVCESQTVEKRLRKIQSSLKQQSKIKFENQLGFLNKSNKGTKREAKMSHHCNVEKKEEIQ